MGTGTWKTIVVACADDHTWLRETTAEISERILAEIPELDRDEQLTEVLHESTADNILLFASLVAADRPADQARPRALAEEFIRQLVQRGVPAEYAAGAYRVGLGTFWRLWVELLRTHVEPTQLADALDASTTFMFRFIDTLSGHVVEIHGRERQEWVRTAEAQRIETIHALLDGDPVDREAAERRLGHPLDRRHRCLAVWLPEDRPDAPDVRELATQVAAATGGLVGPVLAISRTAAAVWVADAPEPAVDPVAPDGVLVAIGEPAGGIAGFARTYRDAMAARRIAVLRGDGPGSLVRYDDVAIQVLASADLEAARRFVLTQLGPLAGPSAADRQLAATLRAYLRHDSNLRSAAASLKVHHNTVANRLRRVEELLDRPLLGRGAELLLALALLEVTRE